MTRVRCWFDFTFESTHSGVDEEDVFESDFESTDEEAAKEEEQAGDKAVQDEERRAKKVCTSVSLCLNSTSHKR